MFISTNYSKAPKIGDIVISTEKLYVHSGFFTTGHIFKVLNKNKDDYSLSDDDGNKVENVSSSKISLIVNLDESSKDLQKTEMKYKKLDSIKNSCKHKDNAWDEYTHFYCCKLNGKNYGKDSEECNPKLECEQYCDKVKLRSHKLDYLNNI